MSDVPAVPSPPAWRFHSAENVAIAAFVGGPLAGSWLLASNEWKQGRRDRAGFTLLAGVAAIAGLLALGALLPEVVPPWVLALAYTLFLRDWANRSQGAAYEAHVAAAGKKGSSWAALGTGLVGLLLCGGAGCCGLRLARESPPVPSLGSSVGRRTPTAANEAATTPSGRHRLPPAADGRPDEDARLVPAGDEADCRHHRRVERRDRPARRAERGCGHERSSR